VADNNNINSSSDILICNASDFTDSEVRRTLHCLGCSLKAMSEMYL